MPEAVAYGGIALTAYLIGSIPTALFIGRFFFGVDIRKHGSGNVGSTNATRVFGWKWGVVVQVVDVLKGVVAVAVLPAAFALRGDEFARALAGVAAVAGHCWSLWAGLRGGKGVNTAAGVLSVLAPLELLVGIAGFAVALLASGYVSLGSLTAALIVPIAMGFHLGWAYAVASPAFWGVFVIATIVGIRHRANIERLLSGREYRFETVWVAGRLLQRLYAARKAAESTEKVP